MTEFWDFFIAREKQYRGYIEMRISGGAANMTEIYIKTEIIGEIQKIDRGLWINLGKYVNGKYVFMPCFDPWSDDVSEETIAALGVLMATIPTVEGWEIRRVKPTDMMLI